ncbi:hypothetical protein CAPTEDRAFT_211632, partial [Capitella teleta]
MANANLRAQTFVKITSLKRAEETGAFRFTQMQGWMCNRVEWGVLQQKRRRFESADVFSNVDYLFADCSVNNGGCQHQCNEYAADEWCSCHNGYKVSTTDWKNCVDIDECEGKKGEDYYGACHRCMNTIGSYTCECRNGYMLDLRTNQICIDINECNGEKGEDYHEDCQICVNTIGSYTCNCRYGYALDLSTNQTCI